MCKSGAVGSCMWPLYDVLLSCKRVHVNTQQEIVYAHIFICVCAHKHPFSSCILGVHTQQIAKRYARQMHGKSIQARTWVA